MDQEQGWAVRRASIHAQLHQGEPAERLLADTEFREEWDLLLTRCPWSTVFQSSNFVLTWLAIYREQFEPVVFVGRARGGGLIAAAFLARNRVTDELVFAGTHHAEYHTVLAHGCEFTDVMLLVTQGLESLNLRHPLRFHFLAPGTPDAWLADRRSRDLRAMSQVHPRSFMALAGVEASLRKKSNKSRISRLRQHGQVQLLQLHSSAEMLPFMDEIMVFCDLRQGAINQSTPFRSDPLKRDFYLRMLDQPEQMHATVLLVGGQLVAAHVGPINGRQVALGLIVHSPLFAQHSPGKVLLLLLGQLLATQGFEELDLTPGAGYKERFATGSDRVYSVQLHGGVAAFRRAQVQQVLRRAAARTIRGLGLDLERVRRLEVLARLVLNWRRWGRYAQVLVRRAFKLIWSKIEFRIGITPSPMPPRKLPVNSRLRALELADLLQYRAESGRQDEYFAFLSEALARLESGQRCYTHAFGGNLLHSSWLILATTTCGTGLGHHPIRFAEEIGVLWDDRTHVSARGQGLHTESIAVRLSDLDRLHPGRRAVTGIVAGNRASRSNYERAGFVHLASAWRRLRFGIAFHQLTFAEESSIIVREDPRERGAL